MDRVGFGYPGTVVFRDLTMSMAPDSVTALVGSNGSGKSTLLSLIARVLRPDRGQIRVREDDIAFAVQRSAVTDSFPITAAEAVMMGRWRRLGLLRRPNADDRAIVSQWLEDLGLADLRDRSLGELSGGQRQRVLLAQAFAQEAPILLLDEPTTGLDAATRTLVIAKLRVLADMGTTIIAATHDSEVIRAADLRLDLDAVS
ncbi:MAG: zinc ABC transporter ATP-binding protein AztA [Dietzia sp.]|nr:zinc ABC transporter ATP-binding protein AztA [Dietzia sp.]